MAPTPRRLEPATDQRRRRRPPHRLPSMHQTDPPEPTLGPGPHHRPSRRRHRPRRTAARTRRMQPPSRPSNLTGQETAMVTAVAVATTATNHATATKHRPESPSTPSPVPVLGQDAARRSERLTAVLSSSNPSRCDSTRSVTAEFFSGGLALEDTPALCFLPLPGLVRADSTRFRPIGTDRASCKPIEGLFRAGSAGSHRAGGEGVACLASRGRSAVGCAAGGHGRDDGRVPADARPEVAAAGVEGSTAAHGAARAAGGRS